MPMKSIYRTIIAAAGSFLAAQFERVEKVA